MICHPKYTVGRIHCWRQLFRKLLTWNLLPAIQRFFAPQYYSVPLSSKTTQLLSRQISRCYVDGDVIELGERLDVGSLPLSSQLRDRHVGCSTSHWMGPSQRSGNVHILDCMSFAPSGQRTAGQPAPMPTCCPRGNFVQRRQPASDTPVASRGRAVVRGCCADSGMRSETPLAGAQIERMQAGTARPRGS